MQDAKSEPESFILGGETDSLCSKRVQIVRIMIRSLLIWNKFIYN